MRDGLLCKLGCVRRARAAAIVAVAALVWGVPAGAEPSSHRAEAEIPLGDVDRGSSGPTRTGAGDAMTPGGIWRSLVATAVPLGGVLALAVGAAWVVRAVSRQQGGLAGAIGAGGRAPSGVLEVLGRYPAGRGLTYVLLRVDRRVLLIGQTAGKGGIGATTLCEITDPDDVASLILKTRDEAGESADRSFREALTAMESGHDRADESAGSGAVGERAVRAQTHDGDRVELLHSEMAEQPGDPLAAMRTRLAAMRGGLEVRA